MVNTDAFIELKIKAPDLEAIARLYSTELNTNEIQFLNDIRSDPLSPKDLNVNKIINVDELRVVKRTPNQLSPDTRQFYTRIGHSSHKPIADVFICSDKRLKDIRQVITSSGMYRIFASAGNIVSRLYHSERPGIIIAHGSACGAIEFAKGSFGERREQTQGLLNNLIDPEKIEYVTPIYNSFFQLNKIPHELRAGIIYFDHSQGKVYLLTDSSNKEKYPQGGYCLKLYQDLVELLRDHYYEDELDEMDLGQNPPIAYLSNFPFNISVDAFRVSTQIGHVEDFIAESVLYPIIHRNEAKEKKDPTESFTHTNTLFIALQKERPAPHGLNELLSSPHFKEYLQSDGKIYIVSVSNKSLIKGLYELTLR